MKSDHKLMAPPGWIFVVPAGGPCTYPYLGSQRYIECTLYNYYFAGTHDAPVGTTPPVQAPPPPPPGPAYVAIGDSLTTGYSIPSCEDNPEVNRNGCTGNDGVPTIEPYPSRVARALGFSAGQLNRVGIWGYGAEQAKIDNDKGYNEKGQWEPQLRAMEKATSLVTGVLGINDMHFSDVPHWVYHCTDPLNFPEFDRDNCQRHADADLQRPEFQSALKVMFDKLNVISAKSGMKVIVPTLYNPYDDDDSCEMTFSTADVIVKTLNAEFARRAGPQVRIANVYDAFVDHGAGSGQSYVFGDECDDSTGASRGIITKIGEIFGAGDAGGVMRHYDPHPNIYGAQVMADIITARYNAP